MSEFELTARKNHMPLNERIIRAPRRIFSRRIAIEYFKPQAGLQRLEAPLNIGSIDARHFFALKARRSPHQLLMTLFLAAFS
ncbi:hypothetical protein PMN64_12050 [Bradyrhizobium sp. UFLA01-814]|uniref:hypothetical protein n=1 Tax=Bradyrhizobium sp. UFLA01-814 TaxID=3023480 RepID=UPI00398B3530